MIPAEMRRRLTAARAEIDAVLAALPGEAAAAPSAEPARKARLALVVGHTAASPGAWSASLGSAEYAWNTDLARRIEAAAPPALEVATFVRDRVGVAGAYADAREWGAAAAIELHFNAAGPSASGTETIFVTPESRPLAEAVQRAMVVALGLRDRGVKPPVDGRGEANLTQMGRRPSILIEPFFGSNPSDARLAEGRKALLARAVAEAAADTLTA